MRRLTLIPVIALLAVGCGGEDDSDDAAQAPPARTVSVPVENKQCGTVPYAPDSDAGAFEITARGGASCSIARDLGRRAEGRRGAFQAHGFSCTSRENPGGQLPSVRWRCTDGDQRIEFIQS